MSRKKKPSVSHPFFSPTPTPSIEKEAKCKVKATDLKAVDALTENQERFFDFYRRGHPALLLHGVAGSGKTYIAMYQALKEILDKQTEYRRLIVVRSAVPSRDIGHLPGDEKEKSEVYMIPYVDICASLFPRLGIQAWARLAEQKTVEFMITSHVRGLTLDDAIVIVDEAQNMTDMELNSIMTRAGERTKMIFCGDFRQTDLSRSHDLSGLKKFMSIVEHMQSFRIVEFNVEDIVRSSLCKEYIIARMHYEDLLTK